jgi:hypothetical protein
MRWLQRLVDWITWSAFMGAGAYRVDGRWRWVGLTLVLVLVLIASPALAATVCGGGGAYMPVAVIAAQAAPRHATIAPAVVAAPAQAVEVTYSVEATRKAEYYGESIDDYHAWLMEQSPTP